MQDDIIIEEVHKIKEKKSMAASRSLPPTVPKLQVELKDAEI